MITYNKVYFNRILIVFSMIPGSPIRAASLAGKAFGRRNDMMAKKDPLAAEATSARGNLYGRAGGKRTGLPEPAFTARPRPPGRAS